MADPLNENLKESPKELDKDLKQNIIDFITKHFAETKGNTKAVIKQFNEEEMIAIEPLYIAVGEIDGQSDTISSMEEMESLVKSFNEANESGILQTSLFHNHKTKAFSVVKAWVNPVECFIGDNLVKEGQPIAKIQFNNKKAWELRKSGVLMGLSIGARAAEVEMLSE